jgi:hypothetical protein
VISFSNPANCAGTETEDWFTQDGPGNNYKNKDTLKRICDSCPAKQECYDYAIEWNVLGFWGGTTEYQRRVIRRQLGIEVKPIVQDEWEWKRKYA